MPLKEPIRMYFTVRKTIRKIRLAKIIEKIIAVTALMGWVRHQEISRLQ
jgi:hypothetical protein